MACTCIGSVSGSVSYHPKGVYDGEYNKVPDFAGALPPALLRDWLAPHVSQGGQAVIMAEEWQTADAVLHLDYLLRQTRFRNRVRDVLERQQCVRLRAHRLGAHARGGACHDRQPLHAAADEAIGIEAVVLPNGLSPDVYLSPDPARCNSCAKLPRSHCHHEDGALGSGQELARIGAARSRAQAARPSTAAHRARRARSTWHEVLREMPTLGLRVAPRTQTTWRHARPEQRARTRRKTSTC